MSEYLKKKIKWCNKIYTEYLNENNVSVGYITLPGPILAVYCVR